MASRSPSPIDAATVGISHDPSHAPRIEAPVDGSITEFVPKSPALTLLVGTVPPTLPVGTSLVPSWLQSGFTIPEDEEGLATLYMEIEVATPPLRNLLFTNRFLSARVGQASLSRVMNIEFLSTMSRTSISEATH